MRFDNTITELGGGSGPLSSSKPPWIVVLVLVALPILFNAVALFPEVQHSTPTGNDQVFHYLFVERANQAISAGDNPFDHWLPELELGFPQFFYYQNVPHLVVVGLYRLLFEQVSLIRVFNLVRYLLLVAFPLTVYWSMRRMEFSMIAAATGAALSPMLSSRESYGFDFNSYIWRGNGMFTQLCGMHLLFIATACVRRTLTYGRGFASAIIASSALVLSELLYGYMFGFVIAALWFLSLPNLSELVNPWSFILRTYRSTARITMVLVPVALITAYQAIPLFAQFQYLNVTLPLTLNPNLEALIPAHQTNLLLSRVHPPNPLLLLIWEPLKLFFGGHFFDNNRLPVITGLVILGILYGIVTHSGEAKLALTMLVVWMMMSVPNLWGGALMSHLPLVNEIPFVRLVAGVHFGAILTAGIGGECIWSYCQFRSSKVRLVAALTLLMVLYGPMLVERWGFYAASAHAMEATDDAIANDQDLPQVLSWLKNAPPGRVYAGSRGNWGQWLKLGGIHLYDLLPIEQFATVMPWQIVSLNAPLLWQLDIPSAELCSLFNIRYVVAPLSLKVPDSYRTKLTTSRYIVYEVGSGSYWALGRVANIQPMTSSEDLVRVNSEWINSPQPAQGNFIAFLSSGETAVPDLAPNGTTKVSSATGLITDGSITPDSLSARVTLSDSAILALKVTFHPNWHVTVDGREEPTFMVSPSFIGVSIGPGRHTIEAEYRASHLKKGLQALACFCLFSTIAIWGTRFGDTVLVGKRTLIGQ